MTVEHPVSGVEGNKFEILGLRYADQGIVRSYPGIYRLSPALGSGDPKSMAVEMNGVVLNRAKVHDPNA